MSYVYVVSPKAQAILATLDVELQERTYDELELLAAHPELIKPKSPDQIVVHDFIFSRHDGHHYIFISVRRDDPARTLWIESIGRFVKRDAQP